MNNIVAPGVSGRLINPNNENSPGFHAYVIVFQWPSAVPSITQLAIGYYTNQLAIRYRYGGNWYAWKVFS